MIPSSNIFTGGVDQDSDPRYIQEGDYISALNVRNGYGSKSGCALPANGNIEVPGDTGLFTIGEIKDDINQSIIYFNTQFQNGGTVHRIWRYFPNRRDLTYPNGRIYPVLESTLFKFSFRRSVFGVCLEGHRLFFTDGAWTKNVTNIETGFSIVGNEIKYIDLNLTLRDNILKYELYWEPDAWLVGNIMSLEIQDWDGNTLSNPGAIYVTTGDPIQDQLETVVDNLVPYGITAVPCHNKLIVDHGIAGQRLVLTLDDTQFVCLNAYPVTLQEEMLTLYRQSPKRYPYPRWVVDAAENNSNLWGETFQFRYRYHYYDGYKSVWSPISYVPTNLIFGYGDDNDLDYTSIVLEIRDTLLDQADWKTFIRKVEIAVRYGETGIFKTVEVLDVADIGLTVHSYTFRNDRILSAIPSDENSSIDAQALKNMENIPVTCNDLTSISDPNGSSYLTLVGLKEGLVLPLCPNLEVEINDTVPTGYDPDDQESIKSFKAYGVYDVGFILEDKYGRQTPVLDSKRVTFLNAFVEAYQGLDVSLDGVVPDNYPYMRIVSTKNQNQAKYWQGVCVQVRYWKWSDENDKLVATTYVAGDAIYVGFEFYYDRDEANTLNTIFEWRTTEQNFLAESGDRIRVLFDSTETITDFDEYDYYIAGYNLTDPSTPPVDPNLYHYSIFVNFDAAQPDFDVIDINLGEFLVAELYRRRTVEDQVFYEISDAIELTPGDVFPSVVISGLGDTYVKGKLFNFRDIVGDPTVENIFPIEFPHLYKFDTTKGGDWGRPHVKDPLYAQRDNPRVRVSDVNQANTNINGLHAFRAAEFINLDVNMGMPQRVIYNDLLTVICQHRIQPIYVSKGEVMDLTGNTLVGVSDRLLTVKDPMMQMWGTQNPESITRYNNYIYGVDRNAGVIWRAAQDGLVAISDIKNSIYFRQWLKSRSLAGEMGTSENSDKCFVGYQPQFDTVYFSWNNQNLGFGFGFSLAITWAYEEGKRNWNGNYSFKPERYSCVGDHFVSFKDGKLYLHELNTPCNYYGVQYDCEIKFAVNAEPGVMKYPKHTRVHADSKWHYPVISIPIDSLNTVGMSSRLLANKFKNYEGVFWADYLRDIFDQSAEFTAILNPVLRASTALLKGRVLRGEVMLVTIRKETPTISDCLRRVDTYYEISNQTQR